MNSGSSDSLVLDQEKVLAALGNRLRWQMFRQLADGSPLHAAQVAKDFGREFDGISKHLRILRRAGLLRSRPAAADRRVTEYFVQQEFRRIAGEIDLGFCLLRIREARPDSVRKPAPTATAAEIVSPEDEPPVQGFGEMLVKNTAMGSGRDG